MMSDHERTLTLAQWIAFGHAVDAKCYGNAAHNRAVQFTESRVGRVIRRVYLDSELITFSIDDPFDLQVLDLWLDQQQPAATTPPVAGNREQAVWDSMREVMAIDSRRGLTILEAPTVFLEELARRGYTVVPSEEAKDAV